MEEYSIAEKNCKYIPRVRRNVGGPRMQWRDQYQL